MTTFLFSSPPSISHLNSPLLLSSPLFRGSLTITEGIETLRALLKNVEIKEEGSGDEEEDEEEKEEEKKGDKGDDHSTGGTDVTLMAPKKAATYRSYTISEILQITG